MTYDSRECFRGFASREPLSNVSSDTHDEEGVEETFVCVGYMPKDERAVHQDRFCHCVKTNDGVDHCTGNDRRDLVELVNIIGRAMSYDENIRVYDEVSDDEMNDMDLVAIMRGEA